MGCVCYGWWCCCCCCLLSCGGYGWNEEGEGEREKQGLRKEIFVNMWVWWVLLEEYVGMVGRSLDDLLLVCLGFDGGGPGKGGAGRGRKGVHFGVW